MSKNISDWIQDLSSDDKRTWQEAVRALGYIGAEAVPHILDALLNEKAPIERITEIFKIVGTDGLDQLAKRLDDKNPPEHRILVARTIGHTRDARLLPNLINALQDPDDEVRAEVALSLKEFSDPRAIAPLLQASRADAVTIRANVALALGSYYRDPRTLPHLITLTKDEAPEVRCQAVRSMASFKEDESVPALLDELTHDPDETVRQFAAASLQALKGDRMVFQRLDRNQDDVTRLTNDAYNQMLADGVLDENDLDMMRHSNPMVRARLLNAVGEKGRANALILILPALTDVNPAVRKTAVNALVRLGADAVPAMQPHLSNNSKYMRIGILEAMSIIGDARCLDIIHELVDDRDVEVRQQLIKTALGFGDDPRTVRIISAMRRDADKTVRDSATEALNALGITESRISGFLRRFLGD